MYHTDGYTRQERVRLHEKGPEEGEIITDYSYNFSDKTLKWAI